MKTRIALSLLALMFLGCAQKTSPAPSTVKYLWTVNSSSGEASLGPQSRPAPGQSIQLRVATDAQPARVLLATFQDQVLTTSPQPALVQVPAESEQVIQWQVPTADRGSKVFTVFLPADGESTSEMEGLLTQLSEPNAATGPAAQRLYERLSEWAGEDRSGTASAGHQVVELGAALSTSLLSPEAAKTSGNGSASPQGSPRLPGRAGAPLFDWRKVCQQVSLGADLHPVVIYDFASAPR